MRNLGLEVGNTLPSLGNYGSAGKESACSTGIPGFNPWVGKIPWRRERLLTPVFWPGEFQGLYGPWSRKESDTTEWLSLNIISLRGISSKSRRLWDTLLFHLKCKPGCKSWVVGPHDQTYTLSNFWFQIAECLTKNGLETKV